MERAMAMSGLASGNDLLDYGIARSLGLIPQTDFDFGALASQLDCTRDFNQVGIIYSEGRRQWLVRSSRRMTTASNTVSHVIVTKINPSSEYAVTKALSDTVQSPALGSEITSTAISCGAMVLTGMLAISAGAAVPFTAGMSGYVAAIITAGTIATVAQCVNGIARISLIASEHDDVVKWLDSESWYVATMTALDIVSLAGAGAGLKSTVETYTLMKKATSTNAINWLKGLSRAEKRRITEAIIRNQNPGISQSGIKAAIRAGIYPKRYPSEALQHSLRRELAVAFTNMTAYGGSAGTGTIRHPENIKRSGQYAIGIIQSFALSGGR